jgi:hypothetical protein
MRSFWQFGFSPLAASTGRGTEGIGNGLGEHDMPPNNTSLVGRPLSPLRNRRPPTAAELADAAEELRQSHKVQSQRLQQALRRRLAASCSHNQYQQRLELARLITNELEERLRSMPEQTEGPQDGFGSWLGDLKEECLREERRLQNELSDARIAQQVVVSELHESYATACEVGLGSEPGSIAASISQVLPKLLQSCAHALDNDRTGTEAADDHWAMEEALFLEAVAPMVAGCLAECDNVTDLELDPEDTSKEEAEDRAVLARLTQRLEALGRRFKDEQHAGQSEKDEQLVVGFGHAGSSSLSTSSPPPSTTAFSGLGTTASSWSLSSRQGQIGSPQHVEGPLMMGEANSEEKRGSRWLLSTRSSFEDSAGSHGVGDEAANAAEGSPTIVISPTSVPSLQDLRELVQRFTDDNEALLRDLQVEQQAEDAKKSKVQQTTPGPGPAQQLAEALRGELAEAYAMLAERGMRQQEASELRLRLEQLESKNAALRGGTAALSDEQAALQHGSSGVLPSLERQPKEEERVLEADSCSRRVSELSLPEAHDRGLSAAQAFEQP